MQTVLIYLFLFFMGSLFGWGIELLFRRFISLENKERRWINPGFLTGPYLPLYGSGLCVLYFMAGIPVPLEDERLRSLVLFGFMAVAMTGLEYIAGLFFVKRLHVRLWDYTNRWGNIRGIICPLFSALWAFLGALYYFLIHPHIIESLEWLADNMMFCLVIGFFYGIFAVDIVYSFQIVKRVKRFAADNDIIVKYEILKASIRTVGEERKEKLFFLFPFRSEVPFREHLEKYMERMGAFNFSRVSGTIQRLKKEDRNKK